MSRDQISAKLKYRFYQHAVQDPPADVDMFERMYQEAYGGEPLVLREDFCGTFLVACEWVKKGPARRALAVDIDPEPLRYGEQLNRRRLTASRRKHVTPVCSDVRCVTKPRADIICAMNFSYFGLKEPRELSRYFRACHQSLKKRGLLAVDIAGGPGFCCAPHREQRSYRYERGRRAQEPWFTYVWRHRHYSRSRREGLYCIDFKQADGRYYQSVFRYDWRVWSLGEVRSALLGAGFREVRVYQQTDDSERYRLIRKDPRDHCWICCLAALR